MRVLHQCLVWCLSSISVQAVTVLPDLITSNVTVQPGVCVVSNQTTITPAGVLDIVGPATVMFVNVAGELRVQGALFADRVMFMGNGADEPWGRLWFEVGSTGMITSCVLKNGGGDRTVEPVAESNAMCYVVGARVVISNTAALNPIGETFTFCGGSIDFVDNVVTSMVTYGRRRGVLLSGGMHRLQWYSARNAIAGPGYPGIVIEGVFPAEVDVKAYEGDRLNFGRVHVSNTTLRVAPGMYCMFGYFGDYYGALHAWQGATVLGCGTHEKPILFVDENYTNVFGNTPFWQGMHFHAGASGIFEWIRCARSLQHTFSNAFGSFSNALIYAGSDIGLEASAASVLLLWNSEVRFYSARALSLRSGSTAYLRNCNLASNAAPYGVAIDTDGSCAVDARYVWWGAPDGPAPIGSGERVITNGPVYFFPWLLAAPGSQTNPPVVEITSPASEPTITSDPQAWLEGIARDDGQVVSVVVQNAASKQRVQVTPGVEGTWRAQIWLYEGMNALAVFAYDEQGNVALDARLVECSGPGVGAGAARPPVMAPMPNRTVRVGELVRARCVATSPDSCVLTYWAANVPAGGVFDQELRELRFIPTQAGVAHVIEFFACDGINVAETSMTIDVVGGDPPVGIRTKVLPRGYRLYPYTYTLIADNAVGPVTWSFSDGKPQDGLVFSRAGVLSGVPLKGGTVNFIAIAQDTRGGAAASNLFSLEISNDKPNNGVWIPFQQVPVCVSGTAYTALTTLTATNGVPAYAWYDAADALSDLGMAIASNGVVAGTPTVPGVHGWLPVVRDQSNGTAYAEMALPVIAPEHRLQRMAGLSKGKLLINRVPGSQQKGALALKMRFTPPPGFTFDQRSPVVAQIGLTQITVPNPFKYTPGTQLVFKKVDGMKSTSISIKYKPGMVQASFTVKKVNLNFDFEQYGIYNENVLVPRTAQIPVWVRIGNYEMATELMPLQFVTAANKSTKGKAAW